MPERAAPRGYTLAFDYGLRRIGVAVGQATTCTASNLQTVRNGRSPDWAAIDRLIREWRPKQLLVGLPLGPEGEETDMSKACRQFGEELGRRYTLPVFLPTSASVRRPRRAALPSCGPTVMYVARTQIN